MKRRPPIWKEPVLLSVVVVLCLLGLVMVFSASFPYSERLYGKPWAIFMRQAIFFVVGLVAMVIVSKVPLRWMRKYSYVALLLAILFSLLVFTPLGTSLGTFSRRWINLRITTLMPSDLIKIGGILAMAKFLTENRRVATLRHGTLPALFLTGLTILPVLLQPDTSTSFIIGCVLFGLFLVYGMNLRHLGPALGLIVLGGGAYIAVDPYRLDRIRAMFDPYEDYYFSGWQLAHSLFAVSAGGVFGRGLGKSMQKFSHLSEAHNDFIFSIISEELGFVGAAFVILLFAVLVLRIIAISLQSKDRFGKILGTGIAALIALQCLVNVSVAVGMIPPTGVPLPFVSYGGTALILFMSMMGMVFSMAAETSMKGAADESSS